MEKPQVLAELTAERLDLCDYLSQLDDDAWTTQSLCAGWNVHDVVAHLVLNTEQTAMEFVKGLIRARGNFDRMSLDQALARAAISPPDELVRQLRQSAGSDRRPPGSSPLDPLLDVIVHGQDIARAVHRERPIQTERAIAAINRAVGTGFYGAKKRFAGVRLIATDADWTNGDGDAELVGPIADLILVATGRPAGIANLTGAGVVIVTQRL